jgi:hypothetical protein
MSRISTGMSTPTEDWKFWQWIGGMFMSALAGAATSGWIARGMIEELKQRLAVCETNYTNLKQKQDACQTTLKEEISQIVELAIANHTIASGERLEEIHQAIKSLATAYDRRQSDTIPTPHGERRDQ